MFTAQALLYIVVLPVMVALLLTMIHYTYKR